MPLAGDGVWISLLDHGLIHGRSDPPSPVDRTPPRPVDRTPPKPIGLYR